MGVLPPSLCFQEMIGKSIINDSFLKVEIKSSAENKKHQISFIQNQSRNQFLLFSITAKMEALGCRKRRADKWEQKLISGCEVISWFWVQGRGTMSKGNSNGSLFPLIFFYKFFFLSFNSIIKKKGKTASFKWH